MLYFHVCFRTMGISIFFGLNMGSDRPMWFYFKDQPMGSHACYGAIGVPIPIGAASL